HSVIFIFKLFNSDFKSSDNSSGFFRHRVSGLHFLVISAITSYDNGSKKVVIGKDRLKANVSGEFEIKLTSNPEFANINSCCLLAKLRLDKLSIPSISKISALLFSNSSSSSYVA